MAMIEESDHRLLLRTAAKLGSVKLISKYLNSWVGRHQTAFVLKVQMLALNAGHVEILEWLRADGQFRGKIGLAEYTSDRYSLDCLKWAKEHGYLSIPMLELMQKGLVQGQPEIAEWAVAGMNMNKTVLTTLLSSHTIVHQLGSAPSQSLDWWWSHGVNMPSGSAFSAIITGLFQNGSHATMEWWWCKFIEHYTHNFATNAEVDVSFTHENWKALDWLWAKAESHPIHASLDWEEALSRSELCLYAPLNVPFYEWWCEKAYLKLIFEAGPTDVTELFKAGDVAGLDCALRNSSYFRPTWEEEFYRDVPKQQNLKLFQWFYNNRTDLYGWATFRHRYNYEHLAPNMDELPGPINAELLDMYRWLFNGDLPDDDLRLAVEVVGKGDFSVVEWWFSVMNRKGGQEVLDLLDLSLEHVERPVVLDIFVDYIHSRGFRVGIPSGVTIEAMPQLTQAWWFAFIEAYK
ncbi:hypothetical protein BC828DRAFT_394133 [Blastocladiella britannica]|nr:hypothetical protein BC828DRAFT_394133 [Blastocladiella britannica]